MLTHTIPSGPPTVIPPPRDPEALPLPPRVPLEFLVFVSHGGDPAFDPLCDLFHHSKPKSK